MLDFIKTLVHPVLVKKTKKKELSQSYPLTVFLWKLKYHLEAKFIFLKTFFL